MFSGRSLAFLLLCTAGFGLSSAAYTFSLENDLRTLLFTTNSYNVLIRPDKTVAVSVTLTIITVDSLDIRNQALKISGYFALEWSDKRLNWTDQATYSSDIPMIYSTETYVWRPPVIIENSIDDISVINDENVPMRITSSGEVTWTPSGIYSTHCESDVIFYPFDTQHCEITMSTWGYTSNEITLQFSSTVIDFSFYKENGEWHYTSYTTSDVATTREKQSFSQLTYILKFKRRPLYHILNTLMPTILLAFLSCMVFKLPADSGEKIGYALTVLLSYAVYLTLVAANIPTTSITPSLLSIYLLFILMMGIFSVILTIFVLDCYFKDPDEEIPSWLRKVCAVCNKLACYKTKFVCCCRPSAIRVQSYDQKDGAVEKGKTRVQEDDVSDKEEDLTWQHVSKLLDLFCMKLYLIIISFTTCLFLLIFIIGYFTN